MVDVTEGDCYVVDLFNFEGSQDMFQNPNLWKRLLIDTGTESNHRRGIINRALMEYNKLDPWPDPRITDLTTKLKLPSLSGIIITHSDRDHSGNADLLLHDLSKDQLGIPFAQSDARPRVPVYLTPMVEWTRNGGPNDPSRFIRLVKAENELKVQFAVRPATAGRSFKDLDELCKAGDYVAMYKFNVLNMNKGWDDAIKSQTKNTELRGMEDFCWKFRNEWQDSPRFDIAAYLSELQRIHKNDYFLQKTPIFEILVEVGLVPRRESRTYEDGAFDIVTGPWLRLTTTFPRPGKAQVPPLPNADKYLDISSMSSPPYGKIFLAKLVDLDDKYGKIFEVGHWSNSMMGCADKQHTRDFQHLILQSMVDPVRGPHNLGCSLILTYSSQNNEDLLPDRKQNLWSEYANRASILNFFTYHRNGNKQDHDDISAPYNDTGDFKMLFTGDAFELSQGLKRMKKLREAVDSIALEQMNTLDNYDFAVPPQARSSRGNLMNWLSGEQGTNQSINVDVLKVPHHGSRMSTDPSFFYFVTAKVYLISGSLQAHGHPAPSTLKAMVRYALSKDGWIAAKAPSKYRSKATQSDAESIVKVRLILTTLEIVSPSPFRLFFMPLFPLSCRISRALESHRLTISTNLAIKAPPRLSVLRHSSGDSEEEPRFSGEVTFLYLQA